MYYLAIKVLIFAWIFIFMLAYPVEGQRGVSRWIQQISGRVDNLFSYEELDAGFLQSKTFARNQVYNLDLGGFVLRPKLATYSLGGSFLSNNSDFSSTGQEEVSTSKALQFYSTTTFLPDKPYPFTFTFARGTTDEEAGSLYDNQTDYQDWGFTQQYRGIKLPNMTFRFNRRQEERTGSFFPGEQTTSNLDLLVQKTLGISELSLNLNQQKTTSDAFGLDTLSRSIRLEDYTDFGKGMTLRGNAFYQNFEIANMETNTLGTALGLNKVFNPDFTTGLNLSLTRSESDFSDITNLNSSGFLAKRFSPKLHFTSSLIGILIHSDLNTLSSIDWSSGITSGHIPYLNTQLGYGIGQAFSSDGEGSTIHSFNLGLSTTAWQRLVLSSNFTAELERGDSEKTATGYEFGIAARPFRSLSLRSSVRYDEEESSRPFQVPFTTPTPLEEALLFPPGGPPTFLTPAAFTTTVRSFSFNNSFVFQPRYWISTDFSFTLDKRQTSTTSIDLNRFNGGVSFFLGSNLTLWLQGYLEEEKVENRKRNGLSGEINYDRGRFNISLSFDVFRDKFETATIDRNFFLIRFSRNLDLLGR